jgi:phosphatidylethanolamine-binding protein
MDFSVETTNSPLGPNTTLIHWILAGLSSPNDTITLSSRLGPIAPYFPPGPPPGQTHMYGVFLYSEPARFEVPADFIPFFNNLTASVFNRVGFNLTHFAGETGLGAPVAADWFLVSTPSTPSSSATLGPASMVSPSASSSSVARLASPSSVTPSAPSRTFAVQTTSGALRLGVWMTAFWLGAAGSLLTVL